MSDERRLILAIRARRRALDLTQTEFGRQIDRSLSYVANVERHCNDDDMPLGFYRRAAEVLRLECRLELTLKK